MPPKNPASSLGKKAEDYTSDLLVSLGYKIIARNFRSRFGEIDIIAINEDCLKFIEVKARFSHKFGAPQEAVTPQKIYKIRRTGEYFSLLHPELPKRLRIEVVALEMESGRVISSKIIKVD